MKSRLYLFFSILFIIASVFFITSCKKKESYKVYFLDRNDDIVFSKTLEEGSRVDDFPFIEYATGAYYKWDIEEANNDYDLSSLKENIVIYGDVEYADCTYKVYYNDVFMMEETIKYNKKFNNYPALPKNAVVRDEKKEIVKESNYSYICTLKVTYEIVEPTYTIKFFDDGSEVLEHLTYKKGDAVSLPSYSKNGYIFEGWFLSDISLTKFTETKANMEGDLVFYARFTEKEVHNTITLPSAKYHFTGVKKTQTSTAGVYTTQPVLPTILQSSPTLYDWTSSNESVATISAYSSISAKKGGYTIITATLKTDSKVTVNAIFKVTSEGVSLSDEASANTINVFNVTFKGKDGEVISVLETIENGTVIYPTPPKYEGYSFVRWDKDNYNIKENTIITAIYEEKTNQKDYTGKSFSILGDSISTYQSVIPGGFSCFYPYPTADVNDYNLTWWMMSINRLGGSLFLNNSYSGSCVASESNSSTYKKSRLEHLCLEGQYADVCLIFMGANDAASGSISNNLFKERYKIMIETLQEMAPEMDLILLTLPTNKLYSEERRDAFNAIITELASFYNLDLIDLSTVDIRNDLVDSAHPKVSGMKLLADKIVLEMKK